MKGNVEKSISSYFTLNIKSEVWNLSQSLLVDHSPCLDQNLSQSLFILWCHWAMGILLWSKSCLTLLIRFRWMCSFSSYYFPMPVLGRLERALCAVYIRQCTFQKQFIEETSIHASKLFIWANQALNLWKIQKWNMEICCKYQY